MRVSISEVLFSLIQVSMIDVVDRARDRAIGYCADQGADIDQCLYRERVRSGVSWKDFRLGVLIPSPVGVLWLNASFSNGNPTAGFLVFVVPAMRANKCTHEGKDRLTIGSCPTAVHMQRL